MSDATNLAELREKALAYAESSLLSVPLCLDPHAKKQMDQLESTIARLETQRSKQLLEATEGKSDARLAASPVGETEKLLAEAKADLERQKDAAKDATIVLKFGRLRPQEYRKLLKKHRDKSGDVDDEAFSLDLAQMVYRRTESSDGDDFGATWSEVLGILNESGSWNFGDDDLLLSKVFRHNRMATVVPF